MKRVGAAGLFIAVLVSACSSSGGADAQCADIAGTWALSGCSVTPGSCTITQRGCALTVACTAASYTGTISGTGINVMGTGTTPATTTCQGTVNGAVINGSCMSQGGASCTITAMMQ